MKRKLLSGLLMCAMVGMMLTGCGSKEKSASTDDWKEYCLTEEILDDILFSRTGRFNIVDIDNNGIPEIMIRRDDSGDASRSATGYYTILFSFYDFVNESDIDIDEPELFKIAHASDVYVIDDTTIVAVNKCNYATNSWEGTLDRIYIEKNFPASKSYDEFHIYRETEPVTGNLLATFNGDIDGASVSESEAYNKASEFLGMDVTSLPEPEFPYNYDELVEALKNY